MIILDVRTQEEYAEGHAFQSINVPLNTFVEYVSHLNVPKETEFIVCCESGMRANYALDVLTKMGFTHVTNAGSWRAISV